MRPLAGPVTAVVLALLSLGVGPATVTLTGAAVSATTPPTVRVLVSDEVTEGEGIVVSVVLDAATAREVTVRVDTRAGTAQAPGDYQAVHRRVTVPAGERVTRLRVPTSDDALDEGIEDLEIRLSEPRGAELAPSGRSRDTGRIRDDDPLPRARVEPATFTEPALGHRLGFTLVRLSAPSGRRVVVELATRDGTATGGQDFVPLHPVAILAPGARTARVSVEVLSDERTEKVETLRLAVTRVRHATATGATITILDSTTPRQGRTS